MRIRFPAARVVALLLCLLCLQWLWDLCIRPLDPLDKYRAQGPIRIGYAVEAPYAYLTPEGKVTGESPAVAMEVCRRLGLERVEWQLTEFGALIEGLQREQYDVIAAGLFITQVRAEQVCFSRPTFQVGSAILCRKDASGPPEDYVQLKERGLRVAVLSRSYEESRLVSLGLPESRLLRVPDARTGRSMVLEGQAEALALSSPTLRWMARETPGLTSIDCRGETQRFQGAFAFRKSDAELCRAWDRVLEGYIGSADHLKLLAGFGFRPDEVP